MTVMRSYIRSDQFHTIESSRGLVPAVDIARAVLAFLVFFHARHRSEMRPRQMPQATERDLMKSSALLSTHMGWVRLFLYGSFASTLKQGPCRVQ